MLVNTYVKLQMSVEIALPAFSSLYSVSDYYLSLKLRCFTRISGPEKSPNNTREKISYFWWMNGKALTILYTSCLNLSAFSRIMAAKQ